MRIERLGEFGFIEHVKEISPKTKRALLGIGDDCAVIPYAKDRYMLLTQDMLIEKRHFVIGKTHPEKIGHKALAASLSDIAAMGGLPRFYMVSLGIPKGMSTAFLDGFYIGMKWLAMKFGVELIGGDTNEAPVFCCDIMVLGEVEKRYLARRDGARRGDAIFVTGTLGGSRGKKEFTFMPRVHEARRLVSRFRVGAMMDISDGLSSDINRITESSGVGAVVFEQAIPVSKDAESVEAALTNGEDFELLFTLRRDARASEGEIGHAIGVPVTRIGYIVARKFGVTIFNADGEKRPLEPKGFDHFRA